MRVAALAFGILAGLVASLILALGGLDVAADLGSAAGRQEQAIRFGLFVIGNLGIFGAALVLASPVAGAVFLALGAVAWVGAALLMHHTTDFVLITPPALLLLATVFAVIAHFRRPLPVLADQDEQDEAPEVEVLAPERAEPVAPRPSHMMMDAEDEVGMPAFVADTHGRPSAPQALDTEWNPRKRPAPPPRARPAFREIEEDYEDEEPSGFSRFAMGVSGLLSFGLYAALAGAAVLIFWSARNAGDAEPAAIVAEAPAVSSTAEPIVSSEPSSSSEAQDRLAATEEVLTPIFGNEPIRNTPTAPTAPSTTPSELVAETATSQEPGSFGALATPSTEGAIPALANDFVSEDAPPALTPSSQPSASELPPVSAEPSPASAESPTPSVEPEAPVSTPTAVPPGMAWPRAVPAPIAAQRLAPGKGPTTVAMPTTTTSNNSNNTGL